MVREVSAGGVVLRHTPEGWMIAVIEPQREDSGKGKSRGKKAAIYALPKGLVDSGEDAKQTAIREVREETGLSARLIAKLTDIKYVYVRSWGDGERVFKIVSFYLLVYASGEIDAIDPAMRIEVKRALWVRLDGAAEKLAYRGEREVVRKAEEYIALHVLARMGGPEEDLSG